MIFPRKNHPIHTIFYKLLKSHDGGWYPFVQRHLDTILGAQRHCRLKLDASTCCQVRLPVAGKRCHQQDSLSQREGFTDTEARPTPEGEIRKPGQLRLHLRGPAIRVKAFRIGIPAWIMMQHILAHHDSSPLWNMNATNIDIAERAAVNGPDGRADTHGFCNHAFDIGKLLEIIEGSGSVPQYSVDLLLYFRANFGMLSQQIPGPGERMRGGFMTRQEKRHGLVTQLLLIHRIAIFVSRL